MGKEAACCFMEEKENGSELVGMIESEGRMERQEWRFCEVE